MYCHVPLGNYCCRQWGCICLGSVLGMQAEVLEFYECLLDVLQHGKVNIPCFIIPGEVYATEECYHSINVDIAILVLISQRG